MAFPTDPTDLDVEMNLAGTWVNLRTGGLVLDRGITITRGRSDEAGQLAPAQLAMTLNNTDGRFSPRNPVSPYYGMLGRNTPVRASVKRGTNFLEAPGNTGDKVTAPDTAAVSITGDIDVRIDLTTDSWGAHNLAGKFKRAGNQLSWIFQVAMDGTLRLSWTTSGATGTAAVAISTRGIPMYPGRLALRATLDVDNGAGSNTTTFYTSDTISGTWVQLGDPIVGALGTAGITSIFDSTAPIELGDVPDQTSVIPVNGINGTATPFVGRINAFELRNGINGTVVANPVFTAQTAGTTSFADTASTPNTWTLQGNTVLTNRRWRFYGELATIPPKWDVSGNDVYAAVEANGILRRLRQKASPLHSPIRRSIEANANLVAYWPCEDGSDSTSLASAIQGQSPMRINGTPSFASSTVFGASESLPIVAKSRWTGAVPAYTPTTTGQVVFLAQVPAGAAADGTVLARVTTGGSLARMDVVYLTTGGGSISWAGYADDGTAIWTTAAAFSSGFNGALLWLSMEMTQVGADVNATLNFGSIGTVTGSGGLPQTVIGKTFGRIASVIVSPNADVDQVTVGQVAAYSVITDINTVSNQMVGFVGETAGRRIQRLCAETGVAFRGIGNLDDTAAMGVQRTGEFSDILQECVDADLGMLLEPRDMLGIGYRARSSLYNQPARLALNYRGDEISDSLDPTDDDQQILNDFTASRDGGSSYRVVQATGPLSVLPPPNGVGVYDDSKTLNVASDDDLPDQASWRVHVGTVDEARYPQIGVSFVSPGFLGDAALNEAALTLEVGDRVTVANPPPWLPPDSISQLAQGMTETFENFQHSLPLNCSPESPYHVLVLDDQVFGWLDTDGSSLHTGVNATAATLSVDVTAGPLWTTNPSDLPFDIVMGGEVLTVTAISGTSSPQTFTVTRSVNGVVKSQTANTAINVAHPVYVPL